jgi:hypothetical protein
MWVVQCSLSHNYSLLFFWDSEIIETPTPAKKKRVYVVLVASFVHVLIDLNIAA